jgi:hypothetical protein
MSVLARNRTPSASARGSPPKTSHTPLRNAMYSGVQYFVSRPFSGFHHFNFSVETYAIFGSGVRFRSSMSVSACSVTIVGVRNVLLLTGRRYVSWNRCVHTAMLRAGKL